MLIFVRKNLVALRCAQASISSWVRHWRGRCDDRHTTREDPAIDSSTPSSSLSTMCHPLHLRRRPLPSRPGSRAPYRREAEMLPLEHKEENRTQTPLHTSYPQTASPATLQSPEQDASFRARSPKTQAHHITRSTNISLQTQDDAFRKGETPERHRRPIRGFGVFTRALGRRGRGCTSTSPPRRKTASETSPTSWPPPPAKDFSRTGPNPTTASSQSGGIRARA